jgi:hypothetical protein
MVGPDGESLPGPLRRIGSDNGYPQGVKRKEKKESEPDPSPPAKRFAPSCAHQPP